MRHPLTRRGAVALAAALPALLGSAERANAAYGPAGGAVVSKPPLKQLDVEGFLSLSPEKLAQRAGALSQSRLDQVLQQLESKFSTSEQQTLDAFIDRLEAERQQNPSPEVDAEIQRLENKLKEVSQGIAVAKQ